MTSVHALALQADPPAANPQNFPVPSVVALQAAAVVNKNDVQPLAAAHAVPLNEQFDL